MLLSAALFFAGGGAALTAFFTTALVHELGHVAAIWLTGAVIHRVSLTGAGLEIRYGGLLSICQESLITAAGPAAGLLFALLCSVADRPYFRYAGAIALLASLFNLLPVYPMDGGRLAFRAITTVMPERNAFRFLRILGSIIAAGVTATGLWIRSPAAAAAGIWLLVLANVLDLR